MTQNIFPLMSKALWLRMNSYYPIYQPHRSGRIWHKVNFWAEFNRFEFRVFLRLTKAQEFSLSYYLPKAGERITGFILFPRVLVLCEMQLVSSRIWTRVAVSISYDDNHYTTGTSMNSCYRILFSNLKQKEYSIISSRVISSHMGSMYIKTPYMNGLHLFWDSFQWFCFQISSDAKYFSLFSNALWSQINSCYSLLFPNLE